MGIIVFDFDKTLTYKDSLRELFLNEMQGFKYPLRFVYVFLSLLSKFNIISVKREKELMISILFKSDKSLFMGKCINQAKTIELNPIFDKVENYISTGARVIILSASANYLLEEVFKNLKVEIIGTTFICNDGRIKGISRHPFATEKYDILVDAGIREIDEMFYDSCNDECLISLCRKWNKVKNGVIVETKER